MQPDRVEPKFWLALAKEQRGKTNESLWTNRYWRVRRPMRRIVLWSRSALPASASLRCCCSLWCYAAEGAECRRREGRRGHERQRPGADDRGHGRGTGKAAAGQSARCAGGSSWCKSYAALGESAKAESFGRCERYWPAMPRRRANDRARKATGAIIDDTKATSRRVHSRRCRRAGAVLDFGDVRVEPAHRRVQDADGRRRRRRRPASTSGSAGWSAGVR